MTTDRTSSAFTSAITAAMQRAQSTVVLDALKSVPDHMTIRALIESLSRHGLGDALLGLTLGDLRSSAVTAAAAKPVVQQAPVRVAVQAAVADDDDDGEDDLPETPSRVTGAAIEALFAKSARLRTEDVRRELGGSAADVRACMKRLADSRKVRIEGQMRATTYVWEAGA